MSPPSEKPDRIQTQPTRAPTVSEQLEALGDSLFRLMESMKRQGKAPSNDLEYALQLLEKSAGVLRAAERRPT